MDAIGHAGQAADELRRLQAHAHLVPVILAADRGAVHPRAHLDPQDHAFFGNGAGLLRGMRMPKAGGNTVEPATGPGRRTGTNQ